MHKFAFFSKWNCLIIVVIMALVACGDDDEIIFGCTDTSATNYDPLATDDDGSCLFAVIGCMDISAINYDPLATEDDGSCLYSSNISWIENTPSLPYGIGAMGAAEVPNGFMIFGGKSSTTTLSDTYIYSELDGSITQGPNLNIPRSHALCIAMQDNKVLIIGGLDINGTVVTSCEIYDPSTNSIAVTDSMSTARARHKGILLQDNRILVTGGTSILDMTDFFGTIGATTSLTEIYDPATNTWSDGPEMAVPRVTHFMSPLPDGKILINGGLSTTGTLPIILNACEIFNPTSNTLSATANMNVGRSEHTCTTLQDGRILSTGGGTINGMIIDALSDAEIFDPSSETWSSVPNMSIARAGHIGFLLGDGSVVIPTGDSGSLTAITPTTKCEIYNPVTNEWSETGDLPVALSGYAGYITNEQKIVIIGGAISATELSDKVIISEY